MGTLRKIGFHLGLIALTWPALAAAEDGSVRYPEKICTVSDVGEAECVPLASLPSRGLIERLLTDLAVDGDARLAALHCDDASVDEVETQSKVPVRYRMLPKRRRTVDIAEWSLATVERVEQNLLALLRSCHANHTGGVDPVEAGHAPAGAAPVLVAAPQATPAVVVEEPEEVEQTEAEVSEHATDAAEAEEDAGPALALDDTARETDEETTATAALRARAFRLPRARIVSGYAELRPSVRRLVVTWMEGAPTETASFTMDPCSDPIAMPAMGECELSL